MIVKCEQCQTRFKIPDDKVTEKGVKVRCTKCQHTFRVKKEGADAGAPVQAGPASDPFEKFGVGAGPEPGEETRPAMYALGVQATKSGDVAGLSPSFAAQADLPREAFEGPTRVKAMPQPPPGRKPLADPAPFDFSALAPPPPAAPAPKASSFEPQPFDFGALGPAAPEPPARAAPAAAPQKPSMFEPQPFDFSALTAPAAPAPAPAQPLGRLRPPPKPSAFEPQPFDFSSLGTEPAVAAVPPAPQKAKPAPVPSSFEPQPFDFSSLETGEPPPPPPPPALPPAPAQRQSAPAPAPKPPPSAPKRPPAPVPAAPPPAAPSYDLGPAMDFGDPPPPPSAPRAPPPPEGGLLGDIPIDSSALAGDLEPGLEASPEQRGALFDMSSVPEPTNQLQPSEPSEQVAVAKIALKKVTADQLAKPTADEGAVTSSHRPRRSVVGVVWNVLSGVVLLGLLGMLLMVLLNEGKVDASLSWSKLKSLFTTPRELVAFDISNGLYDTRAGRPVFYVRGEVKNRGTHSGRVKVKAEILDGEELVRAAEGWVGATPSPEDLYAIAAADDLSKLALKLAPTAVALKPGSEGAFLVAFYEYPPDLKDFRVRVTVTPEDGSTAAR